MSRCSLAAAMVAGCAFLSTGTAYAAARPSAPEYYVKKATWQDTLLASHEALARHQAAAGKKDAKKRAAELAMSNFEPVSMEVQPRQEAKYVKVNITGVTKLYIGVGGSGKISVGNPELTDIEGDTVPLHVGWARFVGRGWWNHDGLRGWRAMKIGRRTFPRGFQLRALEMIIQLDGPYETLELHVGNTERQPLRFWIDTRSAVQQEQKMQEARKEIQRRVAQYYNIRLADMLSPRRARTVARPRQVAMYLSKQLTTRSLPEIGRKFGGRDHTTVIHAVRRIDELCRADSGMEEDVDLLRRMRAGESTSNGQLPLF